jgi:aminopeptidase N
MRQHVRMPPLTRAEARTRARLLDVRSYSIDLDLRRGDEVFGSDTVIRFGCAEPGAASFAEVTAAKVHRAVLNGRALDIGSMEGDRLPLPGLAADNELRVEADMRYSRTGEGLHRFTDPADGEVYVFASCAPDEASRVFACFDQPDLKGVMELSVTAPEHWTVLGNGTGERVSADRRRFTPTPPISTYLFTVVGGPLHSVRAEHDGIPLGLHCRRSLAPHLDADAEEILEITRRALDRCHELFEERYPFGAYDQAFVPELDFGAMENPGCVTFSDDLFLYRSAVTDGQRELRAVVIAHELSHMWFGDLVTMRWWDDLWLNESFAEYMGHRLAAEATGHTTAWTGFTLDRKSWGYDADQRPSTHPVAPPDVRDTATALVNFDGISYAKGASALRQLVAWIGEDAFLAGVNDFIARHRFGNAELADLLDALGRASGRDVHGWAARWLRTSGIDTVRAEVAAEDGRLVAADIVHSGTPGDPGLLRPHRIRVGLYDLENGGADGARRLVLRGLLGADLAPDGDGAGAGPVRTPLPELIGARRPDLVLPNDGDLGYVKVRLDRRSWEAVSAALSTVEEPLTRALLWNTARDLVRDSELPAGAFLDLVQAHLPAEPVAAIAENVLTVARQEVADRFLPPDRRPAAVAALAAVCREILGRAEDEGRRLTALRSLIRCSETPEELAVLRDWLRTDHVPGGPDLDPELRWAALLRLCAGGAAGDPEISAELARDPSAMGRRGAARCRAALPDPAAKEEAWRGLFTEGALSNRLLTATAEGFWQPGRSGPADGFVDRFFADVPGAGGRGPVVAGILGRTLFPAHAATPDTVAAAEACLDREDLTAALRRALTDQLDDLRRAVRARTLIA